MNMASTQADPRERAPRIDVRFAIEFSADGSKFVGVCLNISKSGLLGKFSHALDPWTEGELALDFAEGFMGIKARVARAVDCEAALVFLFRNDGDRQFIESVIEFAEAEVKVQGIDLKAAV